MIEVLISSGKFAERPDDLYGEWGFQQNGNQLTVAMQEREFEDFLRANNLVVYKDELKSYQDGKVVGKFRLV